MTAVDELLNFLELGSLGSQLDQIVDETAWRLSCISGMGLGCREYRDGVGVVCGTVSRFLASVL